MNSAGRVHALAAWYVDDLLAAGPEGLLRSALECIQKEWKTSLPEFAHECGKEPLKFCGFEIFQDEGFNIHLNQASYIRELVGRHAIEGTAVAPCPSNSALGSEERVPGDANTLRRAQGLTGEVLWLATRSRPDTGFAVSRMASAVTRNPEAVVADGMHLLKYLNGSIDLGLWYGSEVGGFGASGSLPFPQSLGRVETFADASHAPHGGRSFHAMTLLWGGGAIAWDCGKQPLVTLSSTEAELVGYMYACELADATVCLLEDIQEDDVSRALYGDSLTGVNLVRSPGGSWRNRHMRVRALAIKERIASGAWELHHIPGEIQAADMNTKPLSGTRVKALLPLWSMGPSAGPCSLESSRDLQLKLCLILLAASLVEEENRKASLPVHSTSSGNAEAAKLAVVALIAAGQLCTAEAGSHESEALAETYPENGWVLGLGIILAVIIGGMLWARRNRRTRSLPAYVHAAPVTRTLAIPMPLAALEDTFDDPTLDDFRYVRPVELQHARGSWGDQVHLLFAQYPAARSNTSSEGSQTPLASTRGELSSSSGSSASVATSESSSSA